MLTALSSGSVHGWRGRGWLAPSSTTTMPGGSSGGSAVSRSALIQSRPAAVFASAGG